MPEPVVSANSGSNHAVSLSASAKSLLDFEQKLDISLLDSVIDCMYQGELQQQKAAQEILTTLKVSDFFIKFLVWFAVSACDSFRENNV